MPTDQNYYRRSIAYPGSLLVLLACLAGCGGANAIAQQAQHRSFAQLSRGAGGEALQTLPLVLHFQPGDRLAIALRLDSSLATLNGLDGPLEPDAPSLTVTREFWLLLPTEGPPRVSLDGVDFERSASEPNSFGIGIDFTGEAPVLRARLRIRAEPERLTASATPESAVQPGNKGTVLAAGE